MSPFSSLLTSVTVGIIFTMMLQHSNGQFPMDCMDATSLQTRTCCPNNCGGNRGTCTNINIAIPTGLYNNKIVRNNWPYYFTNVCKCSGNYAGFNCSRCKYGYYGSDCSEMIVLPRRPISELSEADWRKYINILKRSRNYSSEYFVFLQEPTGPNTDLTTLRKTPEPVKLYDLFIWQHHYAAKDSEQESQNLKVDYAHESTGFPTWHRQYLLWFEWELQYMLKAMQETDYYMFRLHYWDWRIEMQTDANSPFKHDRLGEAMTANPSVRGDLVNDGWSTRCWKLNSGEICNPNNGPGLPGTFQLQRCPFTGQEDDPCRVNNKDWPSVADVNSAVGMSSYDGGTYNKLSTSGFRNFMEGFNVLSIDEATCSRNHLCDCKIEGSDSECTPIGRLLHNSIHIILGIAFLGSGLDDGQKGVMGDVAAASSDPIFINHHAMIDCILEEWLLNQGNPNVQYPLNNDIPQGHNADDYTVPFFPLVKHREMFKTADNFGYSCRLPRVDVPNQPNPPNPPNNRPDPGNAAIKPGPAQWLFIFVVLGVGSCTLYIIV